MKDCDPTRSTGAHASAPAYEQKTDEAKRERIAGGDRVIQHDRPGRDRRRQPKPTTEDERARHLEVAEIAGSCGDRKAQQQGRVSSHRLEHRHVRTDRNQEQVQVVGVDHHRQSGPSGKPGGEAGRPQSSGSGPEREGLACKR